MPSSYPDTLYPLQFAHCPSHFTEDAIAHLLYTTAAFGVTVEQIGVSALEHCETRGHIVQLGGISRTGAPKATDTLCNLFRKMC